MNCGATFPIPEKGDGLIILEGDHGVVRNFAMSAILHCVNARRFRDRFDSEQMITLNDRMAENKLEVVPN